jgi:hypothetical protein
MMLAKDDVAHSSTLIKGDHGILHVGTSKGKTYIQASSVMRRLGCFGVSYAKKVSGHVDAQFLPEA